MTIPEIPKLGTKFWKELGGKIPFWVWDDAEIGLMQDNQKGLKYRSKSYVKYKANRFERFTDSKWGKKGTKIKAFRATSTEPPQVAFVNLIASGQMLKSLKVKDFGDDYVRMGFGPMHTKKLLGNKMHGYNAIGLNDKNRRLVKMAVIQEMKKRGLELPKKITINVSV